MSDTPTIDWAAREAAEVKDRNERVQAAKTALIVALKSIGAATVTVEYNGEGDSGQVNATTARTAENVVVPLDMPFPVDNPNKSETLETALDEFVWDILYLHHAGFENNDGGYGELVIDVAAGTVDLNHYDRFIDSVFRGTEV